jgi:sterol desaturase/sphingolipid hydroxylase (fatty acid hydroxylase superfamily)
VSAPSLWLSAGLPAGAFAILLWLEQRRPLRRTVEPKTTRLVRNLTVAAVSLVVVLGIERPALGPLAMLIAERRLGLLHIASLPAWLEVGLAVVLMDYTLYVWHVLTHRIPWLWRMHVVHHVDLDMDASTALRFHAAEIALSIFWRAGQVIVIGVSPLAFGVWQTGLLVSTMFHHANVRLPFGLERRLVRIVVTPRMHGIHHSTVRAETDANWSTIFTLWDRLHRTLRLNVPQEAVTIGVPAYPTPADVGLGRLLALPFIAQPPSWVAPTGDHRERPTMVVPRCRLLA